MTRRPRLHAILTGEPSEAARARHQAWLDFQAAKASGDTRRMKETRGALVRATRLKLVEELRAT